MFEKSGLENLGIIPIDRVEDQKVINLVNQVSNKLLLAFPDAKLNYLDIYKALLDTPMFYAKIPGGLSKVNYSYKNSSIYFSDDIDFSDIDEYIFHECLHRLQECRDKKGNLTRLGVCEVNELTVRATALNEGAVQYVTAKAFDMPRKTVNIYGISMPSRTEYYPILTNIVSQIAYLLGEDVLIDSTINGNEEFKIAIIDNIGESQYHYIEKNLNEILKTKDSIMELQKCGDSTRETSDKIIESIELIKSLYFDTQNMIFISYFDSLLKRVENTVEINMVRKKLYTYRELIGTTQDYEYFDVYLADFERRARAKAEEIRNKKALMVVGDNIIFRLIRKIKGLFTNSRSEYYK